MRRAFLLFMALLLPLVAVALDPREFDDPELEARYRQLIVEIRCVVCQNQTLAESNAALAVDLRDQVREQVAAGRSDREIVEFLTARYGDFVLYRPPFNAMTALLWLSPLLLLLFGVAFAWRALRTPPPPPVDAAARERARRLLDGDAPR